MIDVRGQLKNGKTTDIEKYDFSKDKFVANGEKLSSDDFNYFIIRNNEIKKLINSLNSNKKENNQKDMKSEG